MITRHTINNLLLEFGYLTRWEGIENSIKEDRKFLSNEEERNRHIDMTIRHADSLIDGGVYDGFSGNDLIGLFKYSVISELNPSRLPKPGRYYKELNQDYSNSFWKL